MIRILSISFVLLFVTTITVSAKDLDTAVFLNKSQRWIIVDGGGVGIVLNSKRGTEHIIDSSINEITNAHGEIVFNNKTCEGNLGFFNGSFFDLGLPKSNCGWGHVVKFEEASPLLQKLSSILLLQERIRIKFHDRKNNLEFIKKDIFKSVKEVSSLIKKIKKNEFGEVIHEKEGIIESLNSSIKQNLNSIENINKFQTNELNLDLLKETSKNLSNAYDYELKAIKKITKL